MGAPMLNPVQVIAPSCITVAEQSVESHHSSTACSTVHWGSHNAQGLGLRAQGLGLRVPGLGFRAADMGSLALLYCLNYIRKTRNFG